MNVMYRKIVKALLFLLLFIIWFVKPKPSYALYCTLSNEFTYRPSVVIATAEEQRINCKNVETITKFNKNFTIKGYPANQFEIKTTTPRTKEACKDYPYPAIITRIAGAPDDPDFDLGKKYLMAIFPDKNPGSINASLAACGQEITTEISGVFDPKVILTTIRVYTQPIWIIGVFVGMLLFLVFRKFLPDTPTFILSGLVVLILYGLVIYFLIRFVRYLMKKIRKPKLN